MNMDALYQKRLRDGFPGGGYEAGIKPVDQAQGLRELILSLDDDGTTHTSIVRQVNKADLWDEMKSDLEALSRGLNVAGNSPNKWAFGITQETQRARWALQFMEQAEIFARVRLDLGAKNV